MTYNQPFYVGNDPRFRYAKYGYLPPLEYSEPVQEIKPVFRPRPVDKEIDQLKAELKHLHNEIDRMKITKKNEAMPF